MSSLLRYSMPVLQSWRGAGLGNEAISWGKALIGAHELGLRAGNPPWSLNRRGYRRDFETGVFDWLVHQGARTLPSVTVGIDAARQHDDYADVMRDLLPCIVGRKGPLIVRHASGMTGGFYGIRRAREHLRLELTKPTHVVNDLYAIEDRLNRSKLNVALHIRGGDFLEPRSGPQPGEFNRMVPIEWFIAVAHGIRRAFGDRVQFTIFTDDPESPELVRAAREIRHTPLPLRKRPVLSDVLAMASADLLVCSVSALSMLAAFLSRDAYVWYEPHLGELNGWRGIWGFSPRERTSLFQRNTASLSQAEPLYTRGVAADEAGVPPDALYELLHHSLLLKDARRDLILYGAVRARG